MKGFNDGEIILFLAYLERYLFDAPDAFESLAEYRTLC